MKTLRNFFPAALVLLSGISAHAAIVAGLNEPTGTIRTDNYPGAGFGFYAPTDGTTINRIGYWDEGGDGLLADHQVALYRYNGSSYDNIAQVMVSSGEGSILDNGYRWVSIPELQLDNNGQDADFYLLLATHGSDPWTDGLLDAAPMDPSIGSLASRALLVDTSTLESPEFSIEAEFPATSDGYGGANIGFAVPEPSSVFLLASASMALTFQRRRKAHR